MNKRAFLGIVFCLSAITGTYAQIHRTSPKMLPTGDYEAGVVWVKVKPDHQAIFQQGAPAGKMPAQIRATNIKPLLSTGSRNKAAQRLAPRKVKVDLSRYYKLTFDKGYPVEDYINDLYATGYFETVEPVYVEKSLFTPNDPAMGNQYYLNLIRAGDAWDVTQGSTSLVIAIVDTGGDLNHPDLQNNIYVDPADPTDGIDNDGDGYIDNNRGWDFSGADAALIGTPGFIGDNDPQVYSGNRFGHGTMVAGCASATTNDGVGISGVGFNTKLLFTKHYADNQPDNSNTYSSNLYEGVLYAALHGARIINCSWGNPNASGIGQDIIRYVTLELGCLVVAAAGNSNVESPLYPAAYEYVLSVASSDENDVRSFFSNYGKSVDIIAPGSNIYTTNYDNAYRTDSGTSLSAPIVSGAAALVWAHNPAFTPLQVAEQLRVSADETFYVNNAAYINKLGKGRLDVARALTFQSPSVRASNQVLVNDIGDSPGPGEHARLFYDFTNYLSPTSPALTVTLSSASPYVTITQDNFHPGVIGTNGTIHNNSDPFEVTFAANIPIDQPVEALLTYTDGSYHDTQLISFVMPSFIDINENNITTTITSAGRIGFGNTQSQNNGSGFIYDDQSLLFEMGLIMGTSSSMIFDNVRGVGGVYNQDFTSASKIQKMTPGERSYSEVTGSFRNAPVAGSESLLVTFRSMVRKEAPYSNFVILEYVVKNTATDPFTDFHIGLFADWDILSGGASDRAAWDADTRLGYVFPAQPSTLPRVGIQALSGNPNYYAIDNDQTIPGNPLGIYDGFTDAEKFTTLSGGLVKTQAGSPSGGDVSHVVSVGPYTIGAGEEITVAFALHGANTVADLITSAKYADSLYNFTFKASKPIVSDMESCQGADVTIEATGAGNFKWYKDFIGGTPISIGSQFTLSDLQHDTIIYVSNADESFESLRTPANVVVAPRPVITPTGSLDFCENEHATLISSEGDDFTWTSGEKTRELDVTASGSYAVTVLKDGLECTSLPTVITVYPNPVADFILSNEVSATEEELILSNTSTGATSWSWMFGDGETSTVENPMHSYAAIGNYTITLTATSPAGCEAIATKSIGIITGTELPLSKDIHLFPNPVAEGAFVIRRTTNEPFEIKIFDSRGALVHYQSTTQFQTAVDVSGLASGVYHVGITTGEASLIKKIVIVK